jgi:hypothetical protein
MRYDSLNRMGMSTVFHPPVLQDLMLSFGRRSNYEEGNQGRPSRRAGTSGVS